MKRGRPFEPGNKFGRGRPQGSRNKKSLAAQALLDSHAENILRKSVILALQGDAQMLRVLLAHILPRPKDSPVKTGPLRVGTAKEVSESFEGIMRKVASGQLPPSEAQAVASLLEGRRRAIETEDLEARVSHLEQLREDQQGGDNNPGSC